MMLDVLQREAVYLWYYFDVQLRQIFWYWVWGILLGSAISVFAKKWIHAAAEFLGRKIPGIVGICLASALGIASPLCMYGTIPICAAFSRKGVKDDFLAAFMMSSILLNPQLIVYSTALGPAILAVRIASCFLCGIVAGVIVRMYCGNAVATDGGLGEALEGRNRRMRFPRRVRGWSAAEGVPERSGGMERQRKRGTPDRKAGDGLAGTPGTFFDFGSFGDPRERDTDKNFFLRYVKNVLRNVRATGLWFLLGIFLSAVFQRYVPADFVARLFGRNEGFGVLMAATVGVPLYVCGGGTIPLLLDWLADGMSAGSAAAFMITGPATKITNLGALKIAIGMRHFALYILFVMAFSFCTGIFVNVIL